MTGGEGALPRGGSPVFVRQHPAVFLFLLTLILAVTIAGALATGTVAVSPLAVLFFSSAQSSAVANPGMIILTLRATRICAAGLVGAGLSVAGAALQGLFRNPLVSSHILGITPGAGFGAALAILAGFSLPAVAVCAFLGGISALVLTLVLAGNRAISGSLTLILFGIICGALFQALTSLVKYLADPADRLPDIVFWLMGSFNHLPPEILVFSSVLIVIPAAVLLAARWQISLISLGEDHARAVGVDTRNLVFLIVVATTLVASASVALAGMIAWVGLLVPNVVRILTGPDFRLLMPSCALCGAIYLILADTLARSVAFYEIPVGIITAMIGAPVLILLIRKETGWWQ